MHTTLSSCQQGSGGLALPVLLVSREQGPCSKAGCAGNGACLRSWAALLCEHSCPPPACNATTSLPPLECAAARVREGAHVAVRQAHHEELGAPPLPPPAHLPCYSTHAAKRSEGGSGGGGSGDASMRLLSTLLTEMDGMELATGAAVRGVRVPACVCVWGGCGRLCVCACVALGSQGRVCVCGE